MTDEKPNQSRKWNLWLWVGVPLLGLVIIWLIIPIFGHESYRSGRTRSLLTGKGLFPAIKMFAGDHDGRMPQKLDELYPDYVSRSIDELVPRDEDYDSPSRHEWLYFRQPNIDDAAPDDFVLASSNLYGPKSNPKKYRLVIRYDGSGEVMHEPDFQCQLAARRAK